MRIILNGKKVGKNCLGVYVENRAFIKREGLNRKVVLHELYHHLVEVKKLEIPLRIEEKEADNYARCFLKN
jgi:hypothetical protein